MLNYFVLLLAKFIDEIRRDGIYWYNTNIVKSAAKSADVKVDSFMSERKKKLNSDIRLCTGCKCFISGRNVWRHNCCDDKPVRVNPVAMFREPHTDKDFENNILRRFRNGKLGDICRTNRIIQHVGYRHYCLRKSQTSKPVAVRKSVMQDMRELARLLRLKLTVCASHLSTLYILCACCTRGTQYCSPK